MEHVTFTLADLHRHGAAFYDFLGLRKRFFVDQLGWQIPHDEEVEMDQYDNPHAFYSLVLREGRVVAGIRAMPTTARWGEASYMLRDAVEGKLAGIPEDIVAEAVVSPTVWEATRVVISDALSTQADRAFALGTILDGVVEEARAHGGRRIIALCPPVFARTLRGLGYDVELIGSPYVNAEDGRKYVAMAMPADARRPRQQRRDDGRLPARLPEIAEVA